MYEEMEKIESIDTIIMYKMIQSLWKYDYYSTKCLINEFITKRTKEEELENLKQMQDLIFSESGKELESFLIKIIQEEEKARKKYKSTRNVR